MRKSCKVIEKKGVTGLQCCVRTLVCVMPQDGRVKTYIYKTGEDVQERIVDVFTRLRAS